MNNKAVFILAICFFGCKSHNDHYLLVSMIRNLDNSSEIIFEGTKRLYKEMDPGLADTGYSTEAMLWPVKANKIKLQTAALFNFLEGLKLELKEKAKISGRYGNTKEEDDTNAPEELFKKNRKAKALKEEIIQYKAAVFDISEGPGDTFKSDLDEIMDPISANTLLPDYWSDLFKGKSTLASLLILSKFQNSARIIENKVVKYCYERTSGKGNMENEEIEVISDSPVHKYN